LLGPPEPSGTYLTRAEAILNLRPLVINDDLRVITPAHILSPATTAGYGFASNSSFSRVVSQLRQAITHFWQIWSKQYLAILSADRYTRGSPYFVNLQVGDKVLLRNYKTTNIFAGDS
jgi:hypothetical protein